MVTLAGTQVVPQDALSSGSGSGAPRPANSEDPLRAAVRVPHTQEKVVGLGMANLPRVSEPAQGPALFKALQNSQG